MKKTAFNNYSGLNFYSIYCEDLDDIADPDYYYAKYPEDALEAFAWNIGANEWTIENDTLTLTIDGVEHTYSAISRYTEVSYDEILDYYDRKAYVEHEIDLYEYIINVCRQKKNSIRRRCYNAEDSMMEWDEWLNDQYENAVFEKTIEEALADEAEAEDDE